VFAATCRLNDAFWNAVKPHFFEGLPCGHRISILLASCGGGDGNLKSSSPVSDTVVFRQYRLVCALDVMTSGLGAWGVGVDVSLTCWCGGEDMVRSSPLVSDRVVFRRDRRVCTPDVVTSGLGG
jgi:hypothetical protein